MALVAASSESWGVQLLPQGKVTWVEISTNLSAPHGHSQNTHVSKAARMLGFYEVRPSARPGGSNKPTGAIAETAAVEAIADLLHWLQAHGHDADEALDRAQVQFEAEAGQFTTW